MLRRIVPGAGRVPGESTPRRGLPAREAVGIAEVAGTVTLETLPDRDLAKDELRTLVASIAASPDGWAHHVGFDDEHRVFAHLHRDAHVDVWLLCWTPVNDTGWHDHDTSSGAVAVVAGELVGNNLTLGTGAVETGIVAGRAFSFGPEHIHRLNGAQRGSVSVHAYSPPLQRMGQYDVGDDGVLRRVPVAYTDELRPPDAGAERTAGRHRRVQSS